MADFLLKVTKADYQDKLTLLEAAISELEGIRGEYVNLMGQLDDVMERTDDQFAKTEANVKENIRAIELSIANAQKAREAVQTALNGYEELEGQASSLLDNAGDAIESAINAAKKTTSLL